MHLYAWIGIGIAAATTILPLIKKENRTRWAIFQAIWTVLVVIITVLAVTVFGVNLTLALVIAVIALFLSERKVYTKKGLIGVLLFSIIFASAAYYTFKDDPEYVAKFIEENPQKASLYVTKNGEDIIKYQIEKKRPLASTVKVVIAIEYAHQVVEGKLDEEKKVLLSELDNFYIEGTDGGAQPAWLEAMEDLGLIQNNAVALHQVAKGMITYSSNANAEYLMELLGLENINERIKDLDLKDHESVYPFSSALLIAEYTGNKTVDKLQGMSDEDYKNAALDIHNKLKAGQNSLKEDGRGLSLKMQKVWSDRMTRATASDYQKLMAIINQGNLFPPDVQEIIRSLMEWPMEIHESNREKFLHFGAKGGFTAFVLNQAMYIEDKSNNKMEIIMFTDNLSLWEGLKLKQNIDNFLLRLVEDTSYLEYIQGSIR